VKRLLPIEQEPELDYAEYQSDEERQDESELHGGSATVSSWALALFMCFFHCDWVLCSTERSIVVQTPSFGGLGQML